MAELADALDLGSSGQPCGFDPHYPYHIGMGFAPFKKPSLLAGLLIFSAHNTLAILLGCSCLCLYSFQTIFPYIFALEQAFFPGKFGVKYKKLTVPRKVPRHGISNHRPTNLAPKRIL